MHSYLQETIHYWAVYNYASWTVWRSTRTSYPPFLNKTQNLEFLQLRYLFQK